MHFLKKSVKRFYLSMENNSKLERVTDVKNKEYSLRDGDTFHIFSDYLIKKYSHEPVF